MTFQSFGLLGPPVSEARDSLLKHLGPEAQHPQILISTLAAAHLPPVTLTSVLSPMDVWTRAEFCSLQVGQQDVLAARPNRALVQDSRLWPTLPSWWSGLCVGWCGVIPSGRVPALSPLNLSFIPIHTVSHMLLGWAQTHRNARQSWGPRPPYQSHPTLAHAPHHTRTRRLLAATSSYTHIYHAPSVTVAKSRAHVHVLPRIFPGCPAKPHAPRGFLLRTRPTRPHFKASPEVGVSSCRNGLCEM